MAPKGNALNLIGGKEIKENRLTRIGHCKTHREYKYAWQPLSAMGRED